MRSRVIEVGYVCLEHGVEVCYAQNEHVIQAFASYAPHQSLAHRIRPGRLDRRSEHLNSSSGSDNSEVRTVLRIVVTNQIRWGFLLNASVRLLTVAGVAH